MTVFLFVLNSIAFHLFSQNTRQLLLYTILSKTKVNRTNSRAGKVDYKYLANTQSTDAVSTVSIFWMSKVGRRRKQVNEWIADGDKQL